MYDSSLKYKWDNKNVVDYARQEGMEQGIERGIEKGKLEKAIAIASEMKNDGMQLAQISKFTKQTIYRRDRKALSVLSLLKFS